MRKPEDTGWEIRICSGCEHRYTSEQAVWMPVLHRENLTQAHCPECGATGFNYSGPEPRYQITGVHWVKPRFPGDCTPDIEHCDDDDPTLSAFALYRINADGTHDWISDWPTREDARKAADHLFPPAPKA